MDNKIKEYWDNAHKETKLGPLTNSSGISVWEELNIVDLIHKDSIILNIGIGTGRCTKDLIAIGAKVYVLDISEIAINRVKEIVSGYWLSDNIASLPKNTFDLAISHLVTQHIDLKTLTDQIKNVVIALKDGGIFAMQFAYSTYSLRTTEDPTLDNIVGGGMCRTLGQMDDVVSSVGGEIVWAKKTLNCQYWHSGWYAVHIVKRNSTNNKHKWLMV